MNNFQIMPGTRKVTLIEGGRIISEEQRENKLTEAELRNGSYAETLVGIGIFGEPLAYVHKYEATKPGNMIVWGTKGPDETVFSAIRTFHQHTDGIYQESLRHPKAREVYLMKARSGDKINFDTFLDEKSFTKEVKKRKPEHGMLQVGLQAGLIRYLLEHNPANDQVRLENGGVPLSLCSYLDLSGESLVKLILDTHAVVGTPLMEEMSTPGRRELIEIFSTLLSEYGGKTI